MSRQTRTGLLVVMLTLNVCAMSAGKYITYGWQNGGSAYPFFIDWPQASAVDTGLLIAIVLAVLFYCTLANWEKEQRFESRSSFLAIVRPFFQSDLLIVLLWLAVATIAQVLLHDLNSESLSDVAFRDVRGLYASSRHFSISGWLRIYAEAGTVGNGSPPGRVILYTWLRWFCDDPRRLGFVVVALSNLCGVALYYCVLKLFHNRATALVALVYYLFIPAKIYFSPMLNILGWAPIAIAWVVEIKVMADGVRPSLGGVAFGVCVFAALMFDTLGLTLGGLLLMTGLVYQRPARLRAMAIWAMAGFIFSTILLYAFYRVNVLTVVKAMLVANHAYSVNHALPYSPWLLGDLWEFFLGLGTPLSVLCCGLLPSWWQSIKKEPVSARALGLPITLATLLALDLAGLNRGGVMGQWIPLMVLPCIVAADYSVDNGPFACAAALFAMILQTATTISMYRFVL